MSEEISNLELQLANEDIGTMVKLKLYELTSSLIQINEEEILEKFDETQIVDIIIRDYEKHKNNTNILLLLNSVVKSMITCPA